MSKAQFVPVDLSALASPIPESASWHLVIGTAIASLPRGREVAWGVPFDFIGTADGGPFVSIGGGAARSLVIPFASQPVSHALFAHFTMPRPDSADWGAPDGRPNGMPTGTGDVVAEYELSYGQHDTHRRQIRRRFEINDVLVGWGQLAFAARPHRAIRPLAWRGPHAPGEWGYNQTAAELPDYDTLGADGTRRVVGSYWIYALANPEPGRPVESIRLVSRGSDLVVVGGITLFRGDGDPLRHGRLFTVRVETAPDGGREVPVSIDLGVLARRYPSLPFDPISWTSDPAAGLGGPPRAADPRAFYVDVVASRAATLVIDDDEFAVSALQGASPGALSHASTTIEVVDEPKAVIEAKVVDSATGERTPARVHFRTLDGRYIPPYGHRHEVNDAWFEDYGADLILGDTAYAYVDGKFEIELPVGDVLVEVVKGFEYTPTRSRVSIAPGQTHLALEIGRAVDLRAAGWVSADTHVHFVSPETAWLMGQAEGVNVVNLLAAQWGELFTNIADYTGDLSSVSRRDTLVWVGTENRQHVLGHLSLLGKRGSMAEPLSAAGPNESYLGDPLWTGMGGWADTCRAAGGLSVIPHFPNPDGEVAAELILGKIDGVEIRDFRHGIDSYAVRTWYRYLNSGVRIPAMGGTDKMSAGMPIGGVRTYAFIGERELTFEAWADAVRHGRTVTTSGPLLELEVEGQPIGSEIRLPTGGGKVDVRATAFCLQGIGHVELVQDGMIVAREEAPEGAVRVVIETSIDVKQPGWIAARSEGPAVVWHCWPVRMAAHTSPVYVAVGDRDRPPISSGDRAYFATLLEGGMTWLDELGTPVDEQQQRRIRSAFEEAAERLADRDHPTGRRA